MERTRQKLILVIGLLVLFALNLWLYRPLFSPRQMPYKGSIAAGYAGITRFVSEHPNPWGWNPQQYAGQPTQFTYPPLLPYKSSLLHWITGMRPFHAYRAVVAILACLGPVSLAFAFFYFTRSIFWSLALGLAYSCCSPIYGIFEKVDADRGVYYLPWRLLALVKYGEGPHVAGLTILPLAVVAIRWGLARKDFTSLLVMALVMALAPLTNWLCAFALTLCILLMLATDCSRIPRLLLAGALGYGLVCFWLTPEYIVTTLFNWPKDAYGYRLEQLHWPLYAGLAALVITLSLALRYFKTDWLVRYATVGAAGFLWIVGGFYWFGRDTLPESRRYALELELFLVLAIFAWCCMAWRSREKVDQFCVGLALMALLAGSAGQWKSSLSRTPADWGLADREQTLEYKLAQWLDEQKPAGRIFATGSLRFRINALFPMHQVGGTFESGLRNRIAVDYYYQVRTSEASKPDLETMESLQELTAIGAQYAVVHDLGSDEYYKDIKNTGKFAELGPEVFAPTEHDRVYRLPFRSLAHQVRHDELPLNRWKETLPPFYAALNDAQRPALQMREIHPSLWEITGRLLAGHEVSVSMNWDPGWRATQDGAELSVGQNALGLIQLTPAAKDFTRIVLEYKGTGQQKIFAAISALVWIASIALWFRSRSSRVSISTRSS